MEESEAGYTQRYRRHMEPVSLDNLDVERMEVEDDSGMTLAGLEKKLKMQKVLAHMKDEDVDLLFDRYVTLRTIREIANSLGLTDQAVDSRLRTARANFVKAFGDHWA